MHTAPESRDHEYRCFKFWTNGTPHFEEVGQSRGQVLDDEGKNLILRKIAGQYEDHLMVLKGNLKKQGYISEVKSVISEFTQYGVGFEELDVLMENLDEESFLYYKLSDIRMIYEGFEQFLAEKYITKEELLDVLSQMVAKSEILKNSVIALDGFTGFTPVQNRLLGELMSICKEVLVTVEMDGREDAFRYTHPYQLFALSKQMVTGLVQIAGERKIEIADPIYLYDKPVYRFRSNPELGFLESELFRYSRNSIRMKQIIFGVCSGQSGYGGKADCTEDPQTGAGKRIPLPGYCSNLQ